MPAGGQGRRMLEAARRGRKQAGTRRGRLLSAGGWPAWGALRRWWAARGAAGRRLVLGAGALVVALAAGLAVWLSVGVGGPAPRARQYQAYTACLLTGPRGLADPSAARVWAGMEDASAATLAKVQNLPVASGSSEADAQPYLASLLLRHCNLVAAVGAPQIAAVAVLAPHYLSVRFVVVDGRVAGRNVTGLGGPASGVRTAVDNLVRAASAQGG
jgi:hypothetical protein